MASFSVDAEISGSEVANGLKVGVASFVSGVVAAALLVHPSDDDAIFETSDAFDSVTVTFRDLEMSGVSVPGDGTIAGWFFLEAHFASVRASGGMNDGNASFAMDPPVVLYVVVIGVLIASGFLLASLGNTGDLRSGATTGALVVLGYLPLAYFSTHLLYYRAEYGRFSNPVEIEPGTWSVVLVTGLVYPLVFGAIGGVVHELTADEAATDRPA